MQSFQVLVPVLPGGLQNRCIRISFFSQNVPEPPIGFDARLVMVQAENDFLQVWVKLQLPEHSVFRHTVERDIAVVHPIFWVQRDKGQHIHRRFKNVQPVAFADPVKAVPGIAAFHVSLVRFALGISAALVGVTGNPVFIQPYEHGIVVLLILIDELFMGEPG